MEPRLWTSLIAVAFGGAVGALLRYGVATPLSRPDTFPWGTLAVNLAGCFAIGLLFVWAEGRLGEAHRGFVFVGLLGAFTTFSTFGLDSLKLWEAGRHGMVLAYFAASNGLGLLLVWVGLSLGRALGKS